MYDKILFKVCPCFAKQFHKLSRVVSSDYANLGNLLLGEWYDIDV